LVILLFGPPGCGKGTQSPLITDLLKIPAVSTGEMLRSEVNSATPLGKIVADILAQGGLVSDELVNQMLVNRIAKPDTKNGFQLDGYPRTVAQAQFLDEVLQDNELARPLVLYFTAKDSVLIERITSRRQCPACGKIYNLLFKPPKKANHCDADGMSLIRRKDDTVEVVTQRLEEYNKNTRPVIEYYQSSGVEFHTINADRPPAEIFREVEAILRPLVRVQPSDMASVGRA
jgi:adenylate kinase